MPRIRASKKQAARFQSSETTTAMFSAAQSPNSTDSVFDIQALCQRSQPNCLRKVRCLPLNPPRLPIFQATKTRLEQARDRSAQFNAELTMMVGESVLLTEVMPPIGVRSQSTHNKYRQKNPISFERRSGSKPMAHPVGIATQIVACPTGCEIEWTRKS